MGFSIHYCSTETMHPAQAYAIKQHACRLSEGYLWQSCQPVVLEQQTDGYLQGQSKPIFYPAEIAGDEQHAEGLPDGTVLTLAEVLCVLSRAHEVDWHLGHDYEAETIGYIREGVADADLIEELETVGSIGDLLDDLDTGSGSEWEEAIPAHMNRSPGDDDDEPRLLKFPGTQ